MPVRPPPAAAPATCCVPPPWEGFYVGIHAGGGWGHTSFDPAIFESVGGIVLPTFAQPNASPKGGVFGFQFGHNWQWGPVVGGLEIDFSGADIKESTTFFFAAAPGVTFTRDVKIEELASARGRLGYLIFPNWLLYGTAGIGWGHSRLTSNESFDAVFISERSAVFISERSFVNEFGWVAGAGLEWKFFDHWLLRGEWLHYDFGRVNDFDIVSGLSNVRTTVRAALSYKF